MGYISKKDCDTILTNYFRSKNYKLIDYFVHSASEASLGFLSMTSNLKVKVSLNNEVKEVSFFLKFLPQSGFQLKVARTAGSFIKESAFFGDLFSEMRAFLSNKSVPECYLKDNEDIIVLEDLIANGYRNCSNASGFDLEHAFATIRALADIHAASLLYEHKIGKTLDEVVSSEILRPWFCEIEGHPGYKENMAGANIVSLIIDKYFNYYPESILEKAKLLCKNYSNYTQSKSKNHRNVFTHHDLWCNNIMFTYDSNNCVKEAVIIDFQTYGYNPPSLDLLIMIHSNLETEIRNKHMKELLDYYYKCLCKNIQYHKVNPDDILTKKEFEASLDETIPIALTGAALFLNSSAMPEIEMAPIIKDVEKIEVFLNEDRIIVLEILEKYEDYKKRVLDAIKDLLDYIEKQK